MTFTLDKHLQAARLDVRTGRFRHIVVAASKQKVTFCKQPAELLSILEEGKRVAAC